MFDKGLKYGLAAVVCSALFGAGSVAQTPAGTAAKIPPQVQAVNATLKGYLRGNAATYALGFADLNDDGKNEAIVYLTTPEWCRTGGCMALVMTPEGTSYRVVGELLSVYMPIRVLNTKSKGWRDLAVNAGGREAAISFNGVRYPGGWYAQKQLPKDAPGKVVIDPKTDVHTFG
jgi:hypothetical protein